MADSKLTALSEISVPALEDLLYTVDDPSGTPVSNKVSANRFGGLVNLAVVGGRLTTEAGVPLSTSDRTSQGTIYFAPDFASPFCGRVGLYDGTRWKLYSFTEVNLALTLTSGKNYDVFLYDNSGTLTLELSAAWTNDTTRADALTTQNGIYVKSGATTRRYLGTIRASGSNVTEDSNAKRFVWNLYNQLPLKLKKLEESSGSWTYSTATWRPMNNSTSNRVEALAGLAGAAWLDLEVSGGTDQVGSVGISEDGTADNDADIGARSTSLSTQGPVRAGLRKYVPLGYHYYQAVERGNGSTGNWRGTDTTNRTENNGLAGLIWG